jgi:hypothetical protein
MLGRAGVGAPPAAIPTTASTRGEYLDLKYANRHGLITGATGTGKTVTLQILAESFSRAGVPVFCADVKGDLSGIAASGESRTFLRSARQDHRARSTTSMRRRRSSSGTCSAKRATRPHHHFGDGAALLLSRLMDLNDAQEGVLNIAFKLADDNGLPAARPQGSARHCWLSLDGETENLSAMYGNISKQSIWRDPARLLVLEDQGGANTSSVSRR